MNILTLAILVYTLLTASLLAQAPGVMLPYERFDDDHIPASTYAKRRAKILAAHTDKSVIISFSADVRNRQNDVDYEYRQNSNTLYITGVTQEKTTLILIPGGMKTAMSGVKEILFTPQRNQKREVYTGVAMGPDEARTQTGIEQCLPSTMLRDILDSALAGRDTLYIASGLPTATVQNPVSGKSVYMEASLKEYLRERFPDLVVKPTLPMLAAMREIKDDEEMRLLQRAIDISVEAHAATIRAAKPGMKEYELEAVMEYTFKKLGAEDVGYPSIVGSGYNSCILHYTSNRKATKTGDLILADCGAEYHGYTADITRTFPINGRFTNEQRMIYDVVYEAQDSGIAVCRAGRGFREAHQAAMRVVSKRLMELGIITKPEEASYYFMHGTSHYLGLDVHDAGTFTALKPGVVMTVEPGIYIAPGSPCDKKWWNIGVRIEDDILVTSGDPVNLSGALPRRADEIEKMMKRNP
ncbi:MAG: aminopeptidase P N-terminal domain-containing protein [Candidatus Kapabacteria bacterium]|nr:aminopeptidase P N-terminal domain-containing protein [Candidatus Kapabacteria bacterium]